MPKGQPAAGFFVVHRLTGGDNTHGWTTKGDNNPSEDIWHPRDGDIQGAVLTMLPKGGYLLRQFRDPLLYAAIGGCYIGYLMWPRPGTPSDPIRPSSTRQTRRAEPRRPRTTRPIAVRD